MVTVIVDCGYQVGLRLLKDRSSTWENEKKRFFFVERMVVFTVREFKNIDTLGQDYTLGLPAGPTMPITTGYGNEMLNLGLSPRPRPNLLSY